MKKRLLSLVLMTVSSLGQATNPQRTFWGAVGASNPSLWLNFNDSTPAFKDSVSQSTFAGIAQPTISAATSCANSPSGTAISSITCVMATTAGNTAILFASTSTATITSVVDSGGATCSLITSGMDGTSNVYAYACPNLTAASHTFTATLSAAVTYPVLQGVDVVGAATTSPVDTHSAFTSTTSSSSTWTSGSLTTTVQNDQLVGWVLGSSNTYTITSSLRALAEGSWTGIFPATGTAVTAGSYAFTGNMVNTSGYVSVLIAVKPASIPVSPVVVQQPGFDSTHQANYSAGFPYNALNVAPNNTLGAIDWNTPWTMLLHLDRLNWDHTGTLVLASKGDIQGCTTSINCGSTGNWWKLFIQPDGAPTGTSELCFERNGMGGYQAQQIACTGGPDGIPIGPGGVNLNYDIVVEDTGTGLAGALSIYLNGVSVLQTTNQNTFSNGFGNVALAITSGGSGYAASTSFTSTGGGTNCSVTGTATATGGVITSVTTSGGANQGCTSNPTIVLTAPTGTGAVITATSKAMSMNSTTAPLMVPGYLSNGIYYGVDASDASQTPTNIDEFAIFPGDLTFGQITNIFYTTKFYQQLLYPGITANPPLVILGDQGCGPDLSGDQTTAMVINAARFGLIKLLGIVDDDGNANGINSVAWYRQMLDQAGLNDVPVSVGPNSTTTNYGGCPAANLTAYNASTPQNASSYESSVTMYRTLFAKYSTQPIYALVTQTANGYANFLTSPADSISPLTGLQLQAQNAANGGYVSIFQGNLSLTPTYYQTIFNNNGTMPIYVIGGSPADGGPGILVSRTSNDPLYLANTTGDGEDFVSGWTNQNIAQILSPYFYGGVTVTYSGGTGYANSTPFTSTGGGPYCHVTGYMTASGGVPNGIETSWGAPFPATATYNGIGAGCNNPASPPTIVLTAPTGTGVTLTAVPTVTLNCYGTAACTNQYTVWPNVWSVQPSGTGTAPVFTMFQNSLIDPPVSGQPRPY